MVFDNRRNRKGYVRIVITIFALFFLALTFVLFFFLYKWEANSTSERAVNLDFQSVNTELVLKTFLRERVSDKSLHLQNPAPFIRGYTTYSDVISWTCSDPKITPSHVLLSSDKSRVSVKKFFSKLYNEKEDGASKWGLKIIYSDPKIDQWTFGNVIRYELFAIRGIIEQSGSEDDLSYWNNNIRWKNFASQIIPCRNGGLANVLLFANEEGLNQDRLLGMLNG